MPKKPKTLDDIESMLEDVRSELDDAGRSLSEADEALEELRGRKVDTSDIDFDRLRHDVEIALTVELKRPCDIHTHYISLRVVDIVRGAIE